MEIIWELLSQVADGILFHFVWKRLVATFATWGITTKGTPKISLRDFWCSFC